MFCNSELNRSARKHQYLTTMLKLLSIGLPVNRSLSIIVNFRANENCRYILQNREYLLQKCIYSKLREYWFAQRLPSQKGSTLYNQGGFMKIFRSDEEAVSPVIGVILMVAIVVILAAVIAAFVFGMAGNVQTTKTVGVTVAQRDNQTMMFTFQGGKDAPSVMELTARVENATGNVTTGEFSPKPPKVGDSLTVAGSTSEYTGRDHVVVIANFTDGTGQVVLDTYT